MVLVLVTTTTLMFSSRASSLPLALLLPARPLCSLAPVLLFIDLTPLELYSSSLVGMRSLYLYLSKVRSRAVRMRCLRAYLQKSKDIFCCHVSFLLLGIIPILIHILTSTLILILLFLSFLFSLLLHVLRYRLLPFFSSCSWLFTVVTAITVVVIFFAYLLHDA